MASSVPNHPSPLPPDPPDRPAALGTKKSFAALFSNPSPQLKNPSMPLLQPRFPLIDLPARQYGVQGGLPVVSFTAQEFAAGAKLFQHSLIAKFTFGRPSIAEIRDVLKAHWDIKGRATVSDIWDSRHVMIILDSEDDLRSALVNPVRKIGHAMFRLFRYTVDYNPKAEATVTTKWIRLPGLPPPLFNKNFIGSIINSFADFLDVDLRTKACSTMKYARCCVEIDVMQDIPSQVKVMLPNGYDYMQDIIIEGNTFYCSFCKCHGHDIQSCRKKNTKNKVNNAANSASTQVINNQQLPTVKASSNPSQQWLVVESKKHKSKGTTMADDKVEEIKHKGVFSSEEITQNVGKDKESGAHIIKGDTLTNKGEDTSAKEVQQDYNNEVSVNHTLVGEAVEESGAKGLMDKDKVKDKVKVKDKEGACSHMVRSQTSEDVSTNVVEKKSGAKVGFKYDNGLSQEDNVDDNKFGGNTKLIMEAAPNEVDKDNGRTVGFILNKDGDLGHGLSTGSIITIAGQTIPLTSPLKSILKKSVSKMAN